MVGIEKRISSCNILQLPRYNNIFSPTNIISKFLFPKIEFRLGWNEKVGLAQDKITQQAQKDHWWLSNGPACLNGLGLRVWNWLSHGMKQAGLYYKQKSNSYLVVEIWVILKNKILLPRVLCTRCTLNVKYFIFAIHFIGCIFNIY